MAIADNITLLINNADNAGVEPRHSHEPADQRITPRQLHNLQVIGSNPIPETKLKPASSQYLTGCR